MSKKDKWANDACSKLPEGWVMTIELERNSGSVYLVKWDGEEVMFDTDGLGIEDQVAAAVRAAKEAE